LIWRATGAFTSFQATGLTALDARENDFDLMGVQMEALKTGAAVDVGW
jgi:hypothetical protein